MAEEEYPFIPVSRRGDEHLGGDAPEPSPLEMMQLIETLRDFVTAHTTTPYVLDDTEPLAREACWVLTAAITDKPVRHPAEVTAQWYVARRAAACGAAVRSLGKRLEPSIVWLDPADEAGLVIRSRFASWMVRAGGERTRIGPLRAAEIYRDLVPQLSGHGVSRSRPIEMWQETLTGLSTLSRWAGGPAGRHGAISLEAGLAYARLAAQVGRRAEAVACLTDLYRQVLDLTGPDGRRPADPAASVHGLTLLDIELDLRVLGAAPPV